MESMTGTISASGITQTAADARYVAKTSILSSRVTTRFDKTTDITLANVPGLSLTLAIGSYQFRAEVFVTANATGQGQVALSGTATASAMSCILLSVDTDSAGFGQATPSTALDVASPLGAGLGTDYYVTFSGLITISAGGTFTVQFAQNSPTGTSSVRVGSNMIATLIP